MTEKAAPSEIFKKRLKSAREMRQMSQSDLAAKAKLPQTSIAHFESEKSTRKPSFDTLRRLANALEVTTDYLLGRVDNPELAQEADPLFRDAHKLSDQDRELAKGFLEMLAKRNPKESEER